MLYAELQPARADRSARLSVFSTTDSVTELHRLRCFVRAPRAALHDIPKSKRRHLVLFGPPMTVAITYLADTLVFDTLLDRVTWERATPDVMQRHPQPFLGDD